ncbi:MAG TPA: alpha/beta hydrolase [Candidatus Acidoferrales bacterium]|nr:alpha/beta hydrolase [Candidatus Acidoferrales bacterium]
MDYEKDFEEGYEETSFGSIHFKHHKGTRNTILFLHGLGGNTKAFAKLMGFLPDNFDIYLLDLLGHGLSEAPQIDYTVNVQVKALREFISAKNLDCYLFGHSYGGWISVLYAAEGYPCKGIIVEDSAGSARRLEDSKSAGTSEAEGVQLIKDALAINGNKDYVIRSLVGNSGVSTLSATQFGAVSVPTLILWGSDDPVVNIRYASEFGKIKGSRTLVVEGGKHYPHYTKPDEVAKAVTGFIS